MKTETTVLFLILPLNHHVTQRTTPLLRQSLKVKANVVNCRKCLQDLVSANLFSHTPCFFPSLFELSQAPSFCKVLRVLVANLCLTLCDPMDYIYPARLLYGIFLTNLGESSLTSLPGQLATSVSSFCSQLMCHLLW